MAYISTFQHDIFVSYAHVDDEKSKGSMGLVTFIVEELMTMIRQRLPNYDSFDHFFDRRSIDSATENQRFEEAARNSAIFIAICSPNYAVRPHTREELSAFMECGESSRVFAVELLPPECESDYLPPLEIKIRRRFYHMPSVTERNSRRWSITADRDLLLRNIEDVAADIADSLLAMKKGAQTPASSPPVSPKVPDLCPATVADAPPAVQAIPAVPVGIAFAWETPARAAAQDLRRYLADMGVPVLPADERAYPLGGDAFRETVAGIMPCVGLFVQMLGADPGHRPPDLPEGYARCQLNAAREADVPILNWLSPGIDQQDVEDEDHLALLEDGTVTVSTLETFKQMVLDKARSLAAPKDPVPVPGKAPATRQDLVFIGTGSQSQNIAEQVQIWFCDRGCEAVANWCAGAPPLNLTALDEQLGRADALLFLHRGTNDHKAGHLIRRFYRVKATREAPPKALARVYGPPEPPALVERGDGFLDLDCSDGSLDALGLVIEELDR